MHYTPVGGTLEIGGQTYVGTKAITVAALATADFNENIHQITRLWLGQGDTPGKVFGIPGALIGIWLAAKDRQRVKTVAISAAVAAIFAGVVEPFTFMYMFLAPPLFLIDCTLQGLSFAILDATHTSYLGGSTLIEILFNGILQGHKSTWIPIVLLGIALFFIYLFTFKWYIEKFNIPTPCREGTDDTDAVKELEIRASKLLHQNTSTEEVAKEILRKLGGKVNIKEINNCISRLRIKINDPLLVDMSGMKTITDALGVTHPAPDEFHIIFGMRVSEYRDAFDSVVETA